MSTIKYFTEEGLTKLKNDLMHLINVERPSISLQIAEARDKGDLSENAEYEAAKEAQAMLELKIAKLQETISNARIVNPTKVDISKVYIFNSVKVLNLDTKTEIVYTIVPDNEVNIKEGKISMSSPIAGGLLGKKTGDKTEINIPAGKLNLKILKIFRADK